MAVDWNAAAAVYMLPRPRGTPNSVDRAALRRQTTLADAVCYVLSLTGEDRSRLTIQVDGKASGTEKDLLRAPDIEALAQHPDFPKSGQ
jgi:hypothetical protein